MTDPTDTERWKIGNVDGGPLVVRRTDLSIQPQIRVGEWVEVVPATDYEGAVEAMELARIELDTALTFLDPAAAFKGKRSVRLCIIRARHFIGGQ